MTTARRQVPDSCRRHAGTARAADALSRAAERHKERTRMSHSAGLAHYRAALTTPGVGGPVMAALLGRLPIAMVALSLLLYIQRVTGTYATAGLVSAGGLVGVAIGSVGE